MNIADYAGKPYNFRNYNCYHHVAKVRSDNNIKTKMFQPKTKAEAFQIITAQMQNLGSGFSRVHSPQNYDLVMVQKTINNKKRYHCGVYFDGGVSHCCNLFGSVRYETLKDFCAGYEETTFWR